MKAMKAMKSMKAMKAMKAMNSMKAMKAVESAGMPIHILHSEVAELLHMTPQQIEQAIYLVFEIAADQVRRNGSFQLADFLKLKLKVRPATKTKPASPTVTTTPMKKLKQMVSDEYWHELARGNFKF